MSFWKRLWDTPDVVKTSVDAVIKTGDALVYTDEEKAENRARAMEWLLKWQQATTGQNLARRLIAMAVTILWLLESVVALGLSIWAAFEPVGSPVAAAADVCWGAVARMAVPAGVILTFYFAPTKIGEAVTRYQQAKTGASK